MDFITLDFETANSKRSSACAIGIVLVSGGEIVQEEHYYLKPTPFHFDQKNIEIHGITPEMVANSPEFPEVWDKISHFFEKNIVICHNAQFDMSVMKGLMSAFDLFPEKPIKYACSLQLSRKALPELSSHKLSNVAKHFQIDLKHHDALSDALACAKIVMQIGAMNQYFRIKDLLDDFDLKIENLTKTKIDKSKQFKNAGVADRIADKRMANREFEAEKPVDTNHYFYGKNVAFTGELSIAREDAKQMVVDCGGLVNKMDSVTGKTEVLVVGIQDANLVGDGLKSSKERKAEELIGKGQKIEVLSEKEFLEKLTLTNFNTSQENYSKKEVEQQKEVIVEKTEAMLLQEEILQKIKNINSNISKTRAKLDNPNGATPKKIREWENKIKKELLRKTDQKNNENEKQKITEEKNEVTIPKMETEPIKQDTIKPEVLSDEQKYNKLFEAAKKNEEKRQKEQESAESYKKLLDYVEKTEQQSTKKEKQKNTKTSNYDLLVILVLSWVGLVCFAFGLSEPIWHINFLICLVGIGFTQRELFAFVQKIIKKEISNSVRKLVIFLSIILPFIIGYFLL